MQLDELIRLVESGEGEDRALDYAIFVATAEYDRANHWDPGTTFKVTTSLDAVLALIEEKLPGWACKMERNSADLSWGAVWNWHSDKSAKATSPARALLAAFLRAHKEQHDGR